MLEPLIASRTLGVVFFPAFDWAISPTHPERQERLLYTRDQLVEEGLFDIPGIREYRPQFASIEQIERTHFLLPDPGSVVTGSHLAAAGGAIEAARLVLDRQEECAFALVRPPGHHAMRVVHGNRGFCNVNNEAVMIEYIRDKRPNPDGTPLKIAIVDTDVHHGDGTQDIFWNDPWTLFISLHQDGRTLYPGTGFSNESGGPAARGRTVNIPLPPETGDEGYLYVIENAVLPILRDFKPDLVINSAGQDNHFTDPLANMKLTARGYARLNSLLRPDIAVLEGGYSIRGALPYVNLGICLALAGMNAAEEIHEPAWSQSRIRQPASLMPAIAKVCEEALTTYFRPQADNPEESRHGEWISREKNIFYDTDMIQERQRQSWRSCDACPGLEVIETASTRNGPTVCVHIPRHACPSCVQKGLELARSGKQVRLLDGRNLQSEKAR